MGLQSRGGAGVVKRFAAVDTTGITTTTTAAKEAYGYNLHGLTSSVRVSVSSGTLHYFLTEAAFVAGTDYIVVDATHPFQMDVQVEKVFAKASTGTADFEFVGVMRKN